MIYFFTPLQQYINKQLTQFTTFTSQDFRIKLLEEEIKELREILDSLKEKVSNLEREKSDFNIDMSDKLNSFINYNYEIL
jgi:ubiquinone biosynthesis protein UbiJ